MAATNYSSMNFSLGSATKVETQNALKIKKQASPQTPSPQKANKYMGMSDAAIKKAYIGMTQAQKKANGIAMAKASQANKKKKSTASSSSKTTPKPTPTPKGDGSVKAIRVKTSFEKQSEARKKQATSKTEPRSDGLRNLSKTIKKPTTNTQQTSYKPKGTGRGGSRASNNNRGRTQTSKAKEPKVGDTRRIRKGSKYVTQGWTGSRWKEVGGKG
jgi:hypothetical protein